MYWIIICFEISQPIRLKKKSMIIFRCDDCSRKHNNICKLPWKTVLFTDNNKQMELNTVYFSLHIGLIIYCCLFCLSTVQ